MKHLLIGLLILAVFGAQAVAQQELFKLTASDGAAGDELGHDSAISGDRAIVGARLDGDRGSQPGSAYLFDVTTGQEPFKLTASDGLWGDEFGRSVSISGDRAIVGSPFDDDYGLDSGSAYIFDVTTGQELFQLIASDAALGDRFGYRVSINGDRALVAATGNDDDGSNSGSAYIFDVTTGQELFKLIASDAAAGDGFGHGAAISGDRAILGAVSDDDGGSFSGSAYIFDVTTGQELFKLTASDGAEGDEFGSSVSISGDRAIVGAWHGRRRRL